MTGILLPAYVEGVKTRKDKTVAVTLSTQELTPEKAGQLFGANGHLVTVYLSVKEIEITDGQKEIIDSIEAPAPNKSPSQRLRAVLLIGWEQSNEGYTDFNLYYIHKMEKIIDHYKSKLKP